MTKHAITAGLGAPAPHRSADLSDPAAGSGRVNQNEAGGHRLDTMSTIATQHSNFASVEQSSPAVGRRIKAKLIHCEHGWQPNCGGWHE